MKKKVKSIIAFIISVLFFIGTCCIVNTHEAWLDEAQAWLISERLSILEIFKQMKYEGHPCLWHLILAIFSKNGYPYEIIGYISAAISSIMVFLLAKKSPFSMATIVSIILSPMILYQYSVVCRVYCIVLLGIVLVASLYKDRKQKPILYGFALAFLLSTHIIVEGLVGALCIAFYGYEFLLHIKDYSKKERKKIFISMGIVIFAILLLMLQLYSSLNLSGTIRKLPFFVGIPIYDELKLISSLNTFFDSLVSGTAQRVTVYTIFFIFIIISAKKHLKELSIGFSGIIYMFLIYLFVYRIASHTRYIILILFIFTAWIILEKEDNKIKKIIYESMIIILMMFNMWNNYSDIIADIRTNYSGAISVAEYINRSVEENSIILTTRDDEITPIVPYIEKEKNIKFINLNTEREVTYCIWDEFKNTRLSGEELVENVKKYKNQYENVYLIIPWGYVMSEVEEMKEMLDIDMIYEYKYTMVLEKYELFKINELED